MSTLETTSFDETIRCGSKWSSSNTKNAKSIEFVNLKCVPYTQPPTPTHSSALKCSTEANCS